MSSELFNPSHEEKPEKFTSILTASPTPNGNLGVLPREIRDEIYGYVLRTNPEDNYVSFSDFIPSVPSSSGALQNPIFGASTCTRQEAMQVLCSMRRFLVSSHFDLINAQITDMALVNYVKDVRVGPIILTLEEKLKAISLFSGTEVLRKVFVFYITCHKDASGEIIEPPLVEAVKQLTGFKTVTLDVTSEPSQMHDEPKDSSYDAWLDDDPDTRFNALIHALSQALEPALGPSIKNEFRSTFFEWTYYHTDLIFHPQDHLSGKAQATKTHSDVQKDEVTPILSDVTASD